MSQSNPVPQNQEISRLQQVEHKPPTTAVETRTRSPDRLNDFIQSPNRLRPLAANPPEKPQSVNPDAALARLLEGNQRFVNETYQNRQRSRLLETATDHSCPSSRS